MDNEADNTANDDDNAVDAMTIVLGTFFMAN